MEKNYMQNYFFFFYDFQICNIYNSLEIKLDALINKVFYPMEARIVVMSYVSREYITLSSTLITSCCVKMIS